MALYAIGDLHGCLAELTALLDKISFDPQNDRLWFVGDMLSRGPDSLGCLRFIRGLGDRAVAVLGNHEIRAIIGLSGNFNADFDSYMGFFAGAPDRDELYCWMRSLPLVYRDAEVGFTMVHAGFSPKWSIDEALQLSNRFVEIFADAQQTSMFFAGSSEKDYLQEPKTADEHERLRFALTMMTRVRYCNREGDIMFPWHLRAKGLLDADGRLKKDSPYQPWYALRKWLPGEKVVYGHWAAAGLALDSHSFGLDSGSVYGKKLTAMRLDHPAHPIVQVDSQEYFAVDCDIDAEKK